MQEKTLFQELPLKTPSPKEHTDTFNDFSWENRYKTGDTYFSEPTDLFSREKDSKCQFIDKMFPEIFSLVLVSLLLTMSCVKERFQGLDKNNIAFSSNGFSMKESSLTRVF